jgi:hypothetical protein
MELAMRAYSRRHRRMLRNRNAAPLMLVADGNSFADVFASIGRLLFRYRSELAPFTTALVLAAAGELLHAEHPKWWPYVAAWPSSSPESSWRPVRRSEPSDAASVCTPRRPCSRLADG